MGKHHHIYYCLQFRVTKDANFSKNVQQCGTLIIFRVFLNTLNKMILEYDKGMHVIMRLPLYKIETCTNDLKGK